MKKDELKGHLSMTTANMMWGLMSPISKMVLITSIITPFIIVEIRVVLDTNLEPLEINRTINDIP